MLCDFLTSAIDSIHLRNTSGKLIWLKLSCDIFYMDIQNKVWYCNVKSLKQSYF